LLIDIDARGLVFPSLTQKRLKKKFLKNIFCGRNPNPIDFFNFQNIDSFPEKSLSHESASKSFGKSKLKFGIKSQNIWRGICKTLTDPS